MIPRRLQWMTRLQLHDARQPRWTSHHRQPAQQLRRRVARIVVDRERRLLDLAELARVDIDVDDLRVRSESCRHAGCPIVETRADGDQQVTFVDHEVRAARRMHAEHAEIERVPRRQGAQGHQRRRDRNVDALGQLTDE